VHVLAAVEVHLQVDVAVVGAPFAPDGGRDLLGLREVKLGKGELKVAVCGDSVRDEK
jgi:hypothetical protein